MYVDVLTYLFNFVAERLKRGHSGMSSRQLRLRRLYLELVPPTISVTTLVAVTALALDQAIATLRHPPPKDTAAPPDLIIMLLFSGLNLALDVFNVGWYVPKCCKKTFLSSLPVYCLSWLTFFQCSFCDSHYLKKFCTSRSSRWVARTARTLAGGKRIYCN